MRNKTSIYSMLTTYEQKKRQNNRFLFQISHPLK